MWGQLGSTEGKHPKLIAIMHLLCLPVLSLLPDLFVFPFSSVAPPLPVALLGLPITIFVTPDEIHVQYLNIR